ncbi:MAG: ABZJ_00895 family protein [Ectothiorhodospiraceae bacterium]|jgi:hypothetical protein
MEKEVPLTKYTLIFGVGYFAALVLVGVAVRIFDIGGSAGATPGALFAGAIIVVSRFLQDNRRPPSRSEKSKLAVLSLVMAWLVSIVLAALAMLLFGDIFGIQELFQTGGAGIYFGVAAFFSFLYFVLLSFAYGPMAKKNFEAMRRKGKL